MLVTFAFPGHDPATHRKPWCAKVTSWPDNSPAALAFGRTGLKPQANGAVEAEEGDVVCWGAKTLAGVSDPNLSGWGVVTKAGISPCSKEDARHERRMRHPEDTQAAPVVVIPGGRRYGKTAAAARRNPDPNGPKPDWGAALKALAAHDALTAERDALRAHLAAMLHGSAALLRSLSSSATTVREVRTFGRALEDLIPGARDALAGKIPNTEHPDNKTTQAQPADEDGPDEDEHEDGDAHAPASEAPADLEPGLRPVLPEF